MKLVSKILLVAVCILVTGDAAFAADGAAAGGINGLAAGLAIGIAAFGGAIAQGKTAAAALEGIGRNPGASGSMFVPMIIGLALIESLVIYALVVAFKLLG
jgi:F-type H+-transporting ATPase subunit c